MVSFSISDNDVKPAAHSVCLFHKHMNNPTYKLCISRDKYGCKKQKWLMTIVLVHACANQPNKKGCATPTGIAHSLSFITHTKKYTTKQSIIITIN